MDLSSPGKDTKNVCITEKITISKYIIYTIITIKIYSFWYFCDWIEKFQYSSTSERSLNMQSPHNYMHTAHAIIDTTNWNRQLLRRC